ncbi:MULTISPECIES: acrylyl-CoA reductase (NADPH) [Enterobacteriaceae]|uniref:acrylyl-CoA reductase (NADPH) n=1 Tax=Enterobacteriaceae TaxID=543 RepID=UPI0015DCE93D|nr:MULTISPECIES: MDR family oxidoreductase [unclassified Klebsiella]HAT3952751.1 oxidoreductase [Kluyvera ascorbata]BBR57170.1 quinone oxidoreductase [Klebsiella sp. WP4-W18-ESBL-05]BBS89947.1 quinone oxidoreductase [Klebsiella sp. WP7-S18-CRE-02]BBS94969.1 quinone oxidoreductase [Klebsiella sp. WP7-S18-CRE-03]BBT00001.1 quinone oxidoreductase [Klebsiella sp. WP7-S18-ESBL-04]
MQALILDQQDGKTIAAVKAVDDSLLPQGNVTVDIQWSSLNYKDALAITGKGKIIRNFPMVPGIDFAGTVHASDDARYTPGQPVLLTGWGVGENHWGGLSERARVNGDWLVPLPAGLDGRKAMIIGTAGFTAMLCVMALEDAGVRPDDGEIVVTGASGGVGSTAIALLHKLGYQVTAVSGRESTHDYLRALGANRILSRDEFAETRPLEKQIWAGAVDTVGDKVLAKVLAQMNYGGCVAACGLAGGFALPTTVMPFILRNVRLQGVDSVMTPAARRAEAWKRLVVDLPESFFAQSATEIALEDAPRFADKIINNQIQGRTLVKIA